MLINILKMNNQKLLAKDVALKKCSFWKVLDESNTRLTMKIQFP